jgi:hypothetical protein
MRVRSTSILDIRELKAGVIRATKLLQLATKSDFNACEVEMSTHVAS